jgi:hypothetical protein
MDVAHLLQAIVVARTKKVDEPLGSKLRIQLDLVVRKVEHHIWILLEQSVQIQKQVVWLWLKLLDHTMYLQ